MNISHRLSMLHFLTGMWWFKNNRENKSRNCNIKAGNPEKYRNFSSLLFISFSKTLLTTERKLTGQ